MRILACQQYAMCLELCNMQLDIKFPQHHQHFCIDRAQPLCHIKRSSIEVPLGATWVQGTMRTSGFDTIPICPLERPRKWGVSPSVKSFTFLVKGGFVMELTVA
ncbi:hypothetical protein ZIOFF_014349 [Zingiber officinale]|uniref:Uncharacterized protein n=1 Tax=Zingiber officinale TaxID=94328 RepID=A0A8J5HAP3_ZINOF|nr:hypothetical protein ZIOFF_014349 [Zingiber officinale]